MLAALALAIISRNRAEYRAEAHGVSNEQVDANVFGVTALTTGMVVLGALGLYLVVTY